MKKINVPNSFLSLAEEELRAGHGVRLKIDGASMYPFIRGGEDEVEIVPFPLDEKLPEWSCLFFQWGGHYMVHRYIGTEDGECILMGDGNIVRKERVPRDRIIGILCRIYRPDGSIQDCSDRRWLQKARLWYLIRPLRRVLIPAFRLFRVR